jgi:hypothetical protein
MDRKKHTSNSPRFRVATVGLLRLFHYHCSPEYTVRFPNGSQRERVQKLVDAYKTWLPALLETWADEVILQCECAATAWPTYRIMRLIDANTFVFRSKNDHIAALHRLVFPSRLSRYYSFYFYDAELFELRKLVSVHYLSGDPAHIKAAYFGLSKRHYLRLLNAAHRFIAARWIA